MGVTPSAWNSAWKAFEVGGSGNGVVSNAGADTRLYMNTYYTSGGVNTYARSAAASLYVMSSSGQHQWFNASSGTAGTAITFTQAMTLNASGNLGIGTTSPSATLDVRGAATSTLYIGRTANSGAGSQPGSLSFAGPNASGTAFIWNGIRSVIANATAGSEAASLIFSNRVAGAYPDVMTLDSSGNLGLGVTPSAWNSSVRALETATGAFYSYASGSVSNFYMLSNAYLNSGGSPTYKQSAAAAQYLHSAGQHIWYNAPSGTAGNAITFTQAMTLDASGNLGLGVAPSASTGKAFNTTRAWFGSLPGGPYNHAYMSANAYPTSSADPGSAVWLYYSGATGDLGHATRYEQRSGYHEWSVAATGLAGATVSFTKAMVLNPSGNLGLGVAPAAWDSGFKSIQITPASAITCGASNNATYVSSNWYAATSGDKYVVTGYATNYAQASGKHTWYTAPSGTAGAAITFTEAMTLDANGNLGVGTTVTSGSRLNVVGTGSAIGAGTTNGSFLLREFGGSAANNTLEINIRPNSGKSGYLTFTETSVADRWSVGIANGVDALRFISGTPTTGTERMRIDASGILTLQNDQRIQNGKGTAWYNSGNTGYWAAYNSSDALIFSNGTERARFDSSSNLLVATTTASATDTGNGTVLSSTGGYIISRRTSGATQTHLQFVNGGATVGNISSSTTATTYSTSSDYRLKNITGPITNSGAYIDSLNPVEGTWKADGSVFVGLIAHEVQEASRTPVATGVKDGDEMQGMDYSSSEIIANLIAEVKSLRARVAQLESN